MKALCLTLKQACVIIKKRHGIELSISRGDGNYWLVRIANGGLIFSDQFLNTCQFQVEDFVRELEREVIFRGVSGTSSAIT